MKPSHKSPLPLSPEDALKDFSAVPAMPTPASKTWGDVSEQAAALLNKFFGFLTPNEVMDADLGQDKTPVYAPKTDVMKIGQMPLLSSRNPEWLGSIKNAIKAKEIPKDLLMDLEARKDASQFTLQYYSAKVPKDKFGRELVQSRKVLTDYDYQDYLNALEEHQEIRDLFDKAYKIHWGLK